MQVFVKSINGETIAIEHNTVDGIKQKIEAIEGIPVRYQILLFEGKELEDGRELSYYQMQDKPTLHLTMKLEGGGYVPPHLRYLAMHHVLDVQICRKCYGRLSPRATRCHKAKCGRTTNIRPKKIWWNKSTTMQIFVVGLDGETMSVETEQHTVDEVMQHIERSEGVPPELQRLAFEGKELQPGLPLAHYNVRHHSTLHLTMELDGGGITPWPLRVLAMWHVVNKKICRKCYGRLSPAATRCSKAKCGRTSDIRPKKPFIQSDRKYFNNQNTPVKFPKIVDKFGHLWKHY